MTTDLPVLVVALAPDADAGRWFDAFREHLPGFEILSPQDEPDPSRVRYAAAWKHESGALAPYRGAKAIFSLGAGVDHLLVDRALPAGVPLARTVDPDLTNRMSEWVVLHVLLHHRQQRLYDYQQFEKLWVDDQYQPAAKDVRVGIMGLGVLGRDAARKLTVMGFDVAGWSRSPKTVPGVVSFAGRDGLKPFLARTQVLVVLLPLTEATRGILNAELFAGLARDGHAGGAKLINAGRGGLQVEADIVTAIEHGVLRAATLDVFETEPLPKTSELWHHPAITITPHNAAISDPASVAASLAARIEAHENGQPLDHLVARDKGY